MKETAKSVSFIIRRCRDSFRFGVMIRLGLFSFVLTLKLLFKFFFELFLFRFEILFKTGFILREKLILPGIRCHFIRFTDFFGMGDDCAAVAVKVERDLLANPATWSMPVPLQSLRV